MKLTELAVNLAKTNHERHSKVEEFMLINDSATTRADHMPYGGVKDSGIGREGPRYAVEEMTDIRFVSFNLDG